MDMAEDLRPHMAAAEATEDLLRVKEVSRGNRGAFGAEGVVGVSIGDCCWSCIFNTVFVLS
jgi:hypothetical protein